LIGAIVALIIAAVVLLISDRILSGLEVDGFVGAIIAAIAIAVVHWLVAFLLGILGLAFA
jgi:putative membrane protein